MRLQDINASIRIIPPPSLRYRDGGIYPWLLNMLLERPCRLPNPTDQDISTQVTRPGGPSVHARLPCSAASAYKSNGRTPSSVQRSLSKLFAEASTRARSTITRASPRPVPAARGGSEEGGRESRRGRERGRAGHLWG